MILWHFEHARTSDVLAQTFFRLPRVYEVEVLDDGLMVSDGIGPFANPTWVPWSKVTYFRRLGPSSGGHWLEIGRRASPSLFLGSGHLLPSRGPGGRAAEIEAKAELLVGKATEVGWRPSPPDEPT